MDSPDALASAAAGMRIQSERLGVIAENLANAATAGYARRDLVASSFGGQLESSVAVARSQGSLRRTDVPTDLALVGTGYFAVATADGVRYTRDGRMRVDGGHLCDLNGNAVLGSLGPVQFPRGARVDESGRIVAGGAVIDRLRLVQMSGEPEPSGGRLAAAPPAAVLSRAPARVQAGYLEESGVDPIAQMTSLVATQRAYEANQKAAKTADDSLRRAVTDVPAVRP